MNLQESGTGDNTLCHNKTCCGRAFVLDEKFADGGHDINGKVNYEKLQRNFVLPSCCLIDVIAVMSQSCTQYQTVGKSDCCGSLVVHADIQEFCYFFHIDSHMYSPFKALFISVFRLPRGQQLPSGK